VPPGGLSKDPSGGTIRGTVERPPEGLSEDPSGGTIQGAIQRPPEGLSGDPSGELMREYILAVGRLLNPSCGDLHQRSSPTLLPLRYELVTIRSKTLYASS
jgi:hypothetical protein